MCGITGIINYDDINVDLVSLEKMNLAQHHRGPDGNEIYSMGRVAFGHNRLAIIDLEGGVQPIVDDSKQIMLTYNGEVYNYKTIRQELCNDYTFKTECDTEVVLKAYQKWGIQAVHKFDGMFAFALYDKNLNKIFLVRDRFGIKPLYYYHSEEHCIFASELTPLMESKKIPKKISKEALRAYFKYQYVPAPLSIYEKVFKLEPGHYLEVCLNEKKVIKHRYWQLKPSLKESSVNGWLDDLNHQLDRIIRIYCQSDVPFGAFLSGGVDSSLVTALMQKHMTEPVRTFSIGFQEKHHCELPYARQVGQSLGTMYHEKEVNDIEALDVLDRLSIHFGEPFADSSAIPTYFVSQEAAKKVKMILSGDGGDEVFAGYHSYVNAFMDSHNPPTSFSRFLFKLATLIPQGSPFLGKFKNRALFKSLSPIEKHNSQRELFSSSQLDKLLGRSSKETTTHWHETNNLSLDPITPFQLQDIHSYMVDDVLTKVDRMSMANSIEVRVPLLDHHLVEMAFSMPLEMKLKYDRERHQMISKYILKASASRFFSFDFLNRRKTGFGIPINEWCLGPFQKQIKDRLYNSNNPIYEWISFDYVQDLLENFLKHNPYLASHVWAVLQFDTWLKQQMPKIL